MNSLHHHFEASKGGTMIYSGDDLVFVAKCIAGLTLAVFGYAMTMQFAINSLLVPVLDALK